MTPRSKRARGIFVDLEMGGVGRGKKRDERRKSIESIVRPPSAAWGVRGRGALFSRAGYSEGMARRGEELSAPLKSVGTVCN